MKFILASLLLMVIPVLCIGQVLPNDLMVLLKNEKIPNIKAISTDDGIFISFDKKGRIVKEVDGSTREYIYDAEILKQIRTIRHDGLILSFNEAYFDSTKVFKSLNDSIIKIELLNKDGNVSKSYVVAQGKLKNIEYYFYSNTKLDSVIEIGLIKKSKKITQTSYSKITRLSDVSFTIEYFDENGLISKFERYVDNTLENKVMYIYDDSNKMISCIDAFYEKNETEPLKLKIDSHTYVYDGRNLNIEYKCVEGINSFGDLETLCRKIRYEFSGGLLKAIKTENDVNHVYYEYW